MLNLGVFFDHWEAGRWRDALMILDGLNIIPTEEKQTMACVNAEGSLPQLVQRVLPELVVKAMDCLYHEYTEVNIYIYIYIFFLFMLIFKYLN